MNYRTTGIALTAMSLGLTSQVFATNGVNMIGIGPNSRALGGTGIASAQDAVSAVFSNPAAMCLSESCSQPQVDVSFTTFMPKTSAKFSIRNGTTTFKGDSKSDLYFIPAIGVSLPFGEGGRLRGGFAIYGISGLGVDYEGTAISPMAPFDYTNLAIMKIAPSISYAVTPDISIGASIHLQYAELETGTNNRGMGFFGSKHRKDSDIAVGVQMGATWKASECLTFGATYTTAQKNTFKDVMPAMGADGRPNGLMDSGFDLESPQQAGVGVAWVGMKDRLMLAADIKWLNWSDAAGYSDFGWEDQWTFGVGAQYEIIEDKLVARVGYNYGKNPLNNQRFDQDMMSIIGFPAVVEHHLTLGMGYQINESFVLNVAWVHAFENTQSSSVGKGINATSVESSLYEDTIDVGLSWRF